MSTRMGIGFNADASISEIDNYAKSAESLGFESFFMHEHSFGRDAFSFLDSLALSTTKIRLGVACVTPYTRHPIVLATSMMTLQETSGGRAVLGIGTGFPSRLDLLGVKHEKPIGALRDTIAICRGFWEGNALTYSSSNYSLKNVKALVRAPSKKIPIYIAGWKKQMLGLTGKYADGYVAKGGESVHSMRSLVSEIENAALKNGRKLADIDVSAYLLTLVGASKEDALKAAMKDPFVNYMLSVQDDYLYEGTGIDPEKKRPIAENYFKGNLAASSSFITDEMLEAFALVGTADQVAERVNDYRKAGVDLPILQPISMRPEDVNKVMKAGAMLIGTGNP